VRTKREAAIRETNQTSSRRLVEDHLVTGSPLTVTPSARRPRGLGPPLLTSHLLNLVSSCVRCE
jgi:hypothetical protein